MRLLHFVRNDEQLITFVRNDDKARIVRHLSFLSRCSRMCLNYYLSTFAEANAKPVAARPERSGTATSEGHAQIIIICLLYKIAQKIFTLLPSKKFIPIFEGKNFWYVKTIIYRCFNIIICIVSSTRRSKPYQHKTQR
ncbi:MAG: hypothetical protein N3F62_04045 [Bacteroidia bacterium]|nr:hypothetical protein [Bacteroidia bacterium]